MSLMSTADTCGEQEVMGEFWPINQILSEFVVCESVHKVLIPMLCTTSKVHVDSES